MLTLIETLLALILLPTAILASVFSLVILIGAALGAANVRIGRRR